MKNAAFLTLLLFVLWAGLASAQLSPPVPTSPVPVAPVPAAPASNQPNSNDFCHGRLGCRLLWSQPAGRDKDGHDLVVSELVYTASACHRPPDGRFSQYLDQVGQELWLSSFGGLLPDHIKLFAFCNNGYGDASVGEDRVQLGNNSLTIQRFGGAFGGAAGGGANSWMRGGVFSLAPFASLAAADCTFNPHSGSGVFERVDFNTGLIQRRFTPPQPSDAPAPHFLTCDTLEADKAGGGYKSLPIKHIYSFAGIAMDKLKSLGSCATRWRSDAASLSYGQEDANNEPTNGLAQSPAEIAALQINDDVLWVDIHDPDRHFSMGGDENADASDIASNGASNVDRLEVWWLDQNSLDKANPAMAPTAADRRRSLRQFTIRLADLAVLPGYGYGSHHLKLPEVERREAVQHGMVGIRIRWPAEQFPSPQGLSLAYAHADGKVTTAIYSTSAVRVRDGWSIGSLINMEEPTPLVKGHCGVDKDGVLQLIPPAPEEVMR